MRSFATATLLAFLFASSPHAQTAAQNGSALIGHWGVIKAAAAPWGKGTKTPEAEAAVASMLKRRVTFSAHAMSSPQTALNCSDARYEATQVPPEGLFQGSLAQASAAEAAKALGFRAERIAGVDVTCSAGLFSFHFLDANTAVFALDNVIYTLRRR